MGKGKGEERCRRREEREGTRNRKVAEGKRKGDSPVDLFLG
jgi:hypothetical protein